MLTPREAIEHLRLTIINQGPDTPNRHYGRDQWNYLLECIDTLESVLAADPGVIDLLNLVAQQPIEDFDDPDALAALWLTADDIAGRLRDRLRELKYWWVP